MTQILCQRQGQVHAGPVWEGMWNYLGRGERQAFQVPREDPSCRETLTESFVETFKPGKQGMHELPTQTRGSPGHLRITCLPTTLCR